MTDSLEEGVNGTMKYSYGFKEAIVQKVLPPENRSVASVSQESGIPEQTIRNWRVQAQHGTLAQSGTVAGNARSVREKFNLVLESKTIAKDERGKWLRERGVHSEHISMYEQEIREMVAEHGKKEQAETRDLKRENRQLKKELAKKEKALAEMAALYTLKKKADELWGESADA